MDPNVLTIRRDVSLEVVLRYLRARSELPAVFDQLFVVSRDGRYLGDLKLSDLLTKDPAQLVAELMQTSPAVMPVAMTAQRGRRWNLNTTTWCPRR